MIPTSVCLTQSLRSSPALGQLLALLVVAAAVYGASFNAPSARWEGALRVQHLT